MQLYCTLPEGQEDESAPRSNTKCHPSANYMRGTSRLELMPEPDEPSLLTAVDSNAPGYPGESYGISDEEARRLRSPMGPIMRFLWPWGAVGFSAVVALSLIHI